MFLSCALLLGYCHYMYYSAYTEREGERERERETTLFKPTPYWVVSVVPPNINTEIVYSQGRALTLFMLVSSLCLYIGFGVSIPLHIIWHVLCIRFPTNRISILGSKWAKYMWFRPVCIALEQTHYYHLCNNCMRFVCRDFCLFGDQVGP